MLLFKHVFDDNLSDKLPDILSLMRDLSKRETGLQYFESLIKYIFTTVDTITPEKLKSVLVDTLSKDEGELIMTIAEKLKQEGFLKGKEEGIIEGILKGRQKGIQEGIQEGIQKGIQKGIQEGKQQTKYEVICKMRQNGISIEQIAQMTGMQLEEINTLIALFDKDDMTHC